MVVKQKETEKQVRFRPRRLGHVNLSFQNFDEAVSFYQDVVGIELVYGKPGKQSAFFTNGNTHHDLGTSGDSARGLIHAIHHLLPDSTEGVRNLSLDPVDLSSGIMEHCCSLRLRIGFGQPLKCVIHNIVGERHLVRWEVAFEHAPVRPELLDTIVHPRRHRFCQFF